MATNLSIVMADDHPIVRQGLRSMIEADAALVIVAEAGDGQAALALIEKHHPNVAVLDIDMPRMDGFAVARAVRQKKLAVEIVFLTMHSEAELFEAAMDLGVKGYVLKDSASTDIVQSIKTVAAGRPYLSQALSALLLRRRRRADELDEQQPGLHSLSPTERRVLKAIAAGQTSRLIAAELFVSPRTVETHRTNICKKLDLHGNLALVKFAAAHKSDL